ncbi:MAG: hypothetical protein ACRESO_02530, partial [Gammaproteobacteria bacterium]
RGESYICVRRDSEIAYPDQVDVDDDAFVAARGDLKEVDLSNLHSSLGTDGYVFPMTALGDLQGVLVCANRPGEHYAANERKLLSYVAHEVGLALHALRVRETINKLEQKAKLVDALATGTLTSISEIQSQARRLVLGDT